jgi:hypothetical protein
VPTIIDIDERQVGFSIFIVYGQKRGVCTIVNTSTRIVQECPTAIHSVDLWLKGFAAAGVSPISVPQMLGYSST